MSGGLRPDELAKVQAIRDRLVGLPEDGSVKVFLTDPERQLMFRIADLLIERAESDPELAAELTALLDEGERR